VALHGRCARDNVLLDEVGERLIPSSIFAADDGGASLGPPVRAGRRDTSGKRRVARLTTRECLRRDGAARLVRARGSSISLFLLVSRPPLPR
jgi:hypothetical protein